MQPSDDNTATSSIRVTDLVDRCMGSTTIAAVVVDKFEKQMRDDLTRLQELYSEGESTPLALTAHALKGAAGAAGAARMFELAAQVEHGARNNRLDEIGAELDALCGEVERCLGQLPAIRERLKSIG